MGTPEPLVWSILRNRLLDSREKAETILEAADKRTEQKLNRTTVWIEIPFKYLKKYKRIDFVKLIAKHEYQMFRTAVCI